MLTIIFLNNLVAKSSGNKYSSVHNEKIKRFEKDQRLHRGFGTGKLWILVLRVGDISFSFKLGIMGAQS